MFGNCFYFQWSSYICERVVVALERRPWATVAAVLPLARLKVSEYSCLWYQYRWPELAAPCMDCQEVPCALMSFETWTVEGEMSESHPDLKIAAERGGETFGSVVTGEAGISGHLETG